MTCPYCIDPDFNPGYHIINDQPQPAHEPAPGPWNRKSDVDEARQALLDHSYWKPINRMGLDRFENAIRVDETKRNWFGLRKKLQECEERLDCACGHREDAHYTGCLACDRYGREHALY